MHCLSLVDKNRAFKPMLKRGGGRTQYFIQLSMRNDSPSQFGKILPRDVRGWIPLLVVV